jgi:dUTP pyrophosphatase
MLVKYKYVDALALPPIYATKGSACFDLHSCTAIDIPARHKGLIRTGLAFEVPEGYVMLVFSRSGHAAKHSIRLSNCVGVIDSDYRGEVCVLLHNDSDTPFTVHHQDRIAQAMILPVPEVRLELGELSDTKRGSGGFGSTGN